MPEVVNGKTSAGAKRMKCSDPDYHEGLGESIYIRGRTRAATHENKVEARPHGQLIKFEAS